jgi:murein DD-endopeptidase MepM/ murein hydrolase activator NlpD
MRGLFIFRSTVVALLLGGCIPPSAPPQTSAPVGPPRIDAEIDTLFNETPVWEMRPVAANAKVVEGGDYIVQPGDTLRAIGAKTGAGSETLARINDLQPPYTLRVGQHLTVPAGRYHKVSAGETGIAIARAYGVDWHDIVTLNGLTEPFALRIGQRIELPETATPSDRAIETRAAAFKLNIDDILTGGEPASATASVEGAARPNRPLPPTIAVAEPRAFSGSFAWPALGRVASRFGAASEGAINDGIDISVPQRAPILATADGVVAFVGDDVAGYGGLILLRHGDGWISAYGRASQASVTRGQTVKRGQTIGLAGTGTTPLLHFQLRQKRLPVDPLKYLPSQS